MLSLIRLLRVFSELVEISRRIETGIVNPIVDGKPLRINFINNNGVPLLDLLNTRGANGHDGTRTGLDMGGLWEKFGGKAAMHILSTQMLFNTPQIQ